MGTGLGLSQVYGFVTQAGGTVLVESQVGQGTSVTLRLPTTVDAFVLEGSMPEELPTLAGSLLLVEDNEDIVASLVPLLGQLGLRVERRATGDAALLVLAERRADFDAVLSDIVMPGSISGVEMAEQVGRRHAGMPVVLMSGYTAELQRALDRGLTVLPKPCSPATLVAALQEALKGRMAARPVDAGPA
jgi:CheY-like chemotaxis protein